ncbi:MAG: hypothetical protein NVV74_03400 [Magnetospirillum sp.]|nr:hypothetical protein [Magnetospirillum sp.]
MPTQAEGKDQIAPACWFYKYQWAYFRMVPNTWPRTTFSTAGIGTGLMVTDGRPPSAAETDAIIADIQKNLPRGDAEAPPPRASIQSISRIACPKPLDGMELAVAKIWLRQPEVPENADPKGGARPGN